ncbi:hypothetical protein CIW48_16315 [Methylobacterium sp. P1-11]|nr:hypothetical protein CIW48_16315 [Methylobacterium sp. P1-11]
MNRSAWHHLNSARRRLPNGYAGRRSPTTFTAHNFRLADGSETLPEAGWHLDCQDQEHFVLIRDRIRFVLCLYWTDQDLACLPVSDVAAAAERASTLESPGARRQARPCALAQPRDTQTAI